MVLAVFKDKYQKESVNAGSFFIRKQLYFSKIVLQ